MFLAVSLTGELLWHGALALGHVAGQLVQQKGSLAPHLRPRCLAVLHVRHWATQSYKSDRARERARARARERERERERCHD